MDVRSDSAFIRRLTHLVTRAESSSSLVKNAVVALFNFAKRRRATVRKRGPLAASAQNSDVRRSFDIASVR